MVRLKDRAEMTEVWYDRFQFLNGSIKSLDKVQAIVKGNIFQFLNGSIKSKRSTAHGMQLSYFNSSMVRLKVLAATLE